VFDDLSMSFNDVLASSDALLSKPGYGSFVEAASAGVPLLYVGRPDWPESPALIEWLQGHGACREILHEALIQGNLANELAQLWNTSKPVPVVPNGAEQVARWLAERLA
jgi:UDP-N-acetylglucosamine:LPS N-acetylglucosamine transferase